MKTEKLFSTVTVMLSAGEGCVRAEHLCFISSRMSSSMLEAAFGDDAVVDAGSGTILDHLLDDLDAKNVFSKMSSASANILCGYDSAFREAIFCT